MLYFVTLNGREFPLRLERAANAAPRFWAVVTPPGLAPAQAGGAPERELEAELLCPARHGRPALVRVEGRVFRVRLEAEAPAEASPRSRVGQARLNGAALRVALDTELERRARPAPTSRRASGTRVVAPMPGRVVKLNVSVGDRVAPGSALLSVEAMKMENEVQSPGAGRVVSVRVQVGATVESEQELVVIAPE